MEQLEKKLKKQKKLIIILSITIIITAIILPTIYFNKNNKNILTIYFTGYYMQQPSTLPYNEFIITCNEDTIIKVSDFSYKETVEEEERYIPANFILFNGVEYFTNKSFVIYADKANELVIHGSIGTDSNEIIYYKYKPIERYNKQTFNI